MIILTIQGADPTALVAQIESFGEVAQKPFEATIIEWLRKRGVYTERSHDWETVKELRGRLNLPTASGVNRDLNRDDCPAPCDVSRGPTGRIRFLRSHSRLDAFLTRNLKNTA